MVPSDATDTVRSLERPDPSLLNYYIILSFAAGPFFPFVLLPLFFRYRTLRYDFGDEGVSMSWGVLFRREISLTYTRIQDIHLASNAVERWFGLARVLVQTASGAASAEMKIEGLKEFELVRDLLYSRMRGARDDATPVRTEEAGLRRDTSGGGELGELTSTLQAVADELAAIRRQLAVAGGRSAGSTKEE